MSRVRLAVTIRPEHDVRGAATALWSTGMDIVGIYYDSRLVIGDVDDSSIDIVKSVPGVLTVDNPANFIAACDHPSATIDTLTGLCRCIVCARCGQHTGNSNQGHYWAWCSVVRHNRDFHFCCPGDCELEAR